MSETHYPSVPDLSPDPPERESFWHEEEEPEAPMTLCFQRIVAFCWGRGDSACDPCAPPVDIGF